MPTSGNDDARPEGDDHGPAAGAPTEPEYDFAAEFLAQFQDEPEDSDATPAADASTEASTEPRDPTREPGVITRSIPVVGASGYDQDDDDSDVIDDPSPEPPMRRRQRGSADGEDSPAPEPKSAASTPKATADVDPVSAPTPSARAGFTRTPGAARTPPPTDPDPASGPGPDPATGPGLDPASGPGLDPASGPAPDGPAAPGAPTLLRDLAAAGPIVPPAAAPGATPDDRGIDLLTPLHVSPQTPETRGAPSPTAGPAPRLRAGHKASQRATRAPQPRETAEPDGRRSFLTPERTEEPATKGWRGLLTRTGVRMPPSPEERAERDDMSTVSQHWPGPRTIAVVNGKGGSGKTPTTIMTAAVFARFGGAGVLAWDNNQTRGTLGWRTEQGPHDASLHDLLPETDRLLSTQAQSADLARYVHHQTRDRFDVLRSRPMLLADEQRIDSADVDRIHAVAAKYYRLIIMDSGNDESDPMWRRMIDLADLLVLSTTTRAEHAEAGALLLEALSERDERSARLVANSVAIVSQADTHAHTADIDGVVDGYRELSREVAAIPFDPGMAGGHLHYGALRPATQRAWLAATAAIARGIGPQHA
jgi:MinD-like ATPase involved in chromosome partitioning or flagellar assembly